MGIPNANTGNLKDLERRIKRLERANPLSASSLGRGRMRFYDGSELLIQNGALNVTGSATISGVLNVSGQTNLSGQVSVTGPMNITGTTTIGGNTSITGELVVTGPTTLDGITDIGGDTTITGLLDVTGDTTISGKLDVTGPMATKGTLSVEGVTTLKNDLNVTTGGKIKAGNVEIDPTSGGTIRTLNATISDDGATLQILSPTGLQLNGISTNIASPDIRMPSIAPKIGAEANLHIDANGQLWIVS